MQRLTAEEALELVATEDDLDDGDSSESFPGGQTTTVL